MLFNALVSGSARDLTLIALWDGQPAAGPGSTLAMLKLVQERGGRTVIIDTCSIFGLKS
jgi:hypothetical protein